MGRCSFGWTSSRCQRLLSNKSLAYAGTSSRLGMLGRALLLWLLGNLFAYLRQKEAFDCSISKLATWVFLQNSFGISISNLILSGCVGCTISTCAMELFGLLLPTILPLPNGSLLSSLKTAPSGTVEVNLGVLHWWVAGILEWINLCLMLITSFDHLARQSHGKELYGKSGLSQSTASSCGWQFSGSFELEICYLFFLVIPFVCSASMRGSRMTIFFFACEWTSCLWGKIKSWLQIGRSMTTLYSALRGLRFRKSNLEARMRRVSLGSGVYLIWEERNKRIFEGKCLGVDRVFRRFQILFYTIFHFHAANYSRLDVGWVYFAFAVEVASLLLMALVCFSSRWWFSYVSAANCVSCWIFFFVGILFGWLSLAPAGSWVP